MRGLLVVEVEDAVQSLDVSVQVITAHMRSKITGQQHAVKMLQRMQRVVCHLLLDTVGSDSVSSVIQPKTSASGQFHCSSDRICCICAAEHINVHHGFFNYAVQG